MTHPITTSFRPHVATCNVDSTTSEPLRACADEHSVPLGTVVRIVMVGILASKDRRADVIAELKNAKHIAKEGRTQICAMLDDNTQAAIIAITEQTGASRSQVMRATVMVGASHLAVFTAELVQERYARRAAQHRSRERLIKMMNRLQDEVSA